MTPDEELQVFKLISTAGTAKSAYMEAIKHAKDGRADKSPALIADGDANFLESHDVHLEMISSAAQGVNAPASLIQVQAEDQLMATEVTKAFARELVDLYRMIDAMQNRIDELEKKVNAA